MLKEPDSRDPSRLHPANGETHGIGVQLYEMDVPDEVLWHVPDGEESLGVRTARYLAGEDDSLSLPPLSTTVADDIKDVETGAVTRVHGRWPMSEGAGQFARGLLWRAAWTADKLHHGGRAGDPEYGDALHVVALLDDRYGEALAARLGRYPQLADRVSGYIDEYNRGLAQQATPERLVAKWLDRVRGQVTYDKLVPDYQRLRDMYAPVRVGDRYEGDYTIYSLNERGELINGSTESQRPLLMDLGGDREGRRGSRCIETMKVAIDKAVPSNTLQQPNTNVLLNIATDHGRTLALSYTHEKPYGSAASGGTAGRLSPRGMIVSEVLLSPTEGEEFNANLRAGPAWVNKLLPQTKLGEAMRQPHWSQGGLPRVRGINPTKYLIYVYVPPDTYKRYRDCSEQQRDTEKRPLYHFVRGMVEAAYKTEVGTYRELGDPASTERPGVMIVPSPGKLWEDH